MGMVREVNLNNRRKIRLITQYPCRDIENLWLRMEIIELDTGEKTHSIPVTKAQFNRLVRAGNECLGMDGLNKERKEEMAATTNTITIELCASFNMDNVDLSEVMDALEQIKEAATNYGHIEECTLTSALPLKVDAR
jgi:hypothetical protein